MDMEDQEKQESREQTNQESKENQKRVYKNGSGKPTRTDYPNKPHFQKDWLTDEEIDEFLEKNYPSKPDQLRKKHTIQDYQESYGPLTGLSYGDVVDSMAP